MSNDPWTIAFDAEGQGHTLYTEALHLPSLGHLHIRRASRIEFNNAEQQWEVRDMRGTLWYRALSRTDCLLWEHRHFNQTQGEQPCNTLTN